MRTLRDSVAKVTFPLKKHKKIRGDCPLCVPSPYGDVVLKLCKAGKERSGFKWLFPSPYGDVVLKYSVHVFYPEQVFAFPSPCGDVVLKLTFSEFIRSNYMGFRPLAGMWF